MWAGCGQVGPPPSSVRRGQTAGAQVRWAKSRCACASGAAEAAASPRVSPVGGAADIVSGHRSSPVSPTSPRASDLGLRARCVVTDVVTTHSGGPVLSPPNRRPRQQKGGPASGGRAGTCPGERDEAMSMEIKLDRADGRGSVPEACVLKNMAAEVVVGSHPAVAARAARPAWPLTTRW